MTREYKNPKKALKRYLFPISNQIRDYLIRGLVMIFQIIAYPVLCFLFPDASVFFKVIIIFLIILNTIELVMSVRNLYCSIKYVIKYEPTEDETDDFVQAEFYFYHNAAIGKKYLFCRDSWGSISLEHCCDAEVFMRPKDNNLYIKIIFDDGKSHELSLPYNFGLSKLKKIIKKDYTPFEQAVRERNPALKGVMKKVRKGFERYYILEPKKH